MKCKKLGDLKDVPECLKEFYGDGWEGRPAFISVVRFGLSAAPAQETEVTLWWTKITREELIKEMGVWTGEGPE